MDFVAFMSLNCDEKRKKRGWKTGVFSVIERNKMSWGKRERDREIIHSKMMSDL